VKRLSVIFFVVTCFAGQSLADSNGSPINQSPLNECVKDSDCACVLTADHCGFLPESKNRTKKEKTEKEHPACFGPQRYVLPKCQQSQCICQDRGKAPD
jgi:hypothetical protein